MGRNIAEGEADDTVTNSFSRVSKYYSDEGMNGGIHHAAGIELWSS